MRTQYNNAIRTAAVQDSLAAKKLVVGKRRRRGARPVAELKQRLDIEQKRLDDMSGSEKQQIELQQQQIESLRRILARAEAAASPSMRVTSPEAGQLQTLGNPPLELGQYVNAGIALARVVQPGKLKAVLRVPENQAKDVVPGLPATIDLHNNTIVKGHVMRTDPSSVAGHGHGRSRDRRSAAAGTRSDLAVDGTIEIERLNNVLFVGRPGFGQAESSVGIFKVDRRQGRSEPRHRAARPRLGEHDRGQERP